MSIEYGTVRRRVDESGNTVAFMGKLNVPGVVAGNVALIPIATRTEDSPSHAVKVKSAGEYVELGKAWTKRFAERDGTFFTLTLDGPTFSAPLNLTAFPHDPEEQPEGWNEGDDPDSFRLVWSRPRKQNGRKGRAAAGVSFSDELEDEIPFG